MSWLRAYHDRRTDAASAVACLPVSGRIYVGANGAKPRTLLHALTDKLQPDEVSEYRAIVNGTSATASVPAEKTRTDGGYRPDGGEGPLRYSGALPGQPGDHVEVAE